MLGLQGEERDHTPKGPWFPDNMQQGEWNINLNKGEIIAMKALSLMNTQPDGINILPGWLLETRKKQWLSGSKIKNQTTRIWKKKSKAQRGGHEVVQTMEAGTYQQITFFRRPGAHCIHQ